MKNSLLAIAGVAAIAVAGFTVAGLAWLGPCWPPRGPVEPAAPPNERADPAAPPSATAGPKLVLEPSEYDFGRMETDGAGRHDFVLANRGDRPLILSRGKNSCGCCMCLCDARLPDQGRIPPGQSAKVALEWSVRQYTGDFHQSETLSTNDPARPEVTLAVTGRITPTVRVVPTQLVFSRVPAGQPAVGEIRLYGYRAEALKILGREFSDPAKAADFKIDLQPLSADRVSAEADARSGCLLRVEVKPGLAAGPFRQQIVLKTNVDSAPTVEIPIEGTVGSEISVAGFGWDEQTGVLVLGTVAAAKGTERRLQVIVRGPHAGRVRLEPVRIVPDLLKLEVGPSRPLGGGAVTQIPLTVRIPPGRRVANHLGSKASELGRIVIQTGHPKQPELRILVRFAVRLDPAR
jgi:hypothetical protein